MARFLTWEEVKTLPQNTEKWIQCGSYELEYDHFSYNEKEDDLPQERQMSIYTKASKTYRKYWVIWDSFPTEEQILKHEWKVQE